ncbi:uncharacterized protein LOC144152368 [Haemaphysalis longicornis]
MAAALNTSRDELCRNSSAGSTDRSLLTSSPDFLSPPPHDCRRFPQSPMRQAKTRSKSLAATPVSGRLSAEGDEQPTGFPGSLCPHGRPCLAAASHEGSGCVHGHQTSLRAPRLRRARSVSVLVGQNGQVWTQAGDERCPVPTGRQQTAVSLAMDERVIATITQHYYPEGAWGWWICLCAFLVHFLVGGLQGGYALLVVCVHRQYGTPPLPAGHVIRQ